MTFKKSRCERYAVRSDVVRLKGLEPTRIAAREPKSRMSTNSITGAYEGDYQTAIVKLLKKPIAFAIGFLYGAGNEARTRYLHLGKVALYRMSYARKWCLRSELNQRHADFQSAALPTELQKHVLIKWWEQLDSNQ